VQSPPEVARALDKQFGMVHYHDEPGMKIIQMSEGDEQLHLDPLF